MATPGVTITGTLLDSQGNGNAGTVTFILQNLQNTLPQVSGTCIMAPITVKCQAASNGTFSQTLWGNYQIATPNTFYTISIAGSDGSLGKVASYQFNSSGSFDLSTLSPIAPR